MSEERKILKNKDFILKYVHPIYQPLLVEILKERPENIEQFMIDWLLAKNRKPKIINETENLSDPSQLKDQKGNLNTNNEINNLTKRIDTEDIEYGKEYLSSMVGKALEFYETFGEEIISEKKRVSQIVDFMPTFNRGSLVNADLTNLENPNNQEDIVEENENNESQKIQKYSDMESSASEEEDFVEELPEKIVTQNKQRSSVSAEAYGVFNKKGEFKPRVIPKGQEQKEKIMKRINQAFMFSGLDEKETNIVIDSMEEKHYKTGDFVIKQGEDGNELYVVESGELDCFKLFSGNEQETYLKTYQPGESFGELALLYNAPRAATIKAKEDAVLFALDRECFNHIVKDAASKKREKYDSFLQSVEIFSSMDPYERSKVADAFVTHKYGPDEFVCKQGDSGKEFYLVEKGELVALKVMNEGDEPLEVYHYKENDYFGELSILKAQNRQASVKTKTICQIVSLDQSAFKRLLGPLEEILKRNMDRYSKFM